MNSLALNIDRVAASAAPRCPVDPLPPDSWGGWTALEHKVRLLLSRPRSGVLRELAELACYRD